MGYTPLTLEVIMDHPRWKAREEVENMTNRSSAQRNVAGPDGTRHSVPPQEFVLAVDKAGNLVMMPVRPNPVDPYNPNKRNRGADTTSYKRDLIRRKVLSDGFLMVDLENAPDRMFSDSDGRPRRPTEAERRAHWEKVIAETNKRRQVHVAKDAADAERRKPEIQKALEQGANAQAALRERLDEDKPVTRRRKAAEADE